VAKYVKDTDKGFMRFVQEIQAAKTAFVTVGVHEGERSMDGTNIAEYAAHNEYGTQHIPSRPFMRTAFDENTQAIQNDMQGVVNVAKRGGSVVQGLKMVGEKHQQRIQRTIKGRDFLPMLSESTIKAKGSTKTLIDSGAMVNSIRYVVHK
jgi:HK97 gp10 family phage protein